MTPGMFDPATSREVVGDERARPLEAKARVDADAGVYDPPLRTGEGSYWSQCQDEFAFVTYTTQYQKREERNKRKQIAQVKEYK